MPATYTVGDGKTYAWNQTAINAMPGNLAGQGIQTLETYAGGVDIGTGYRYDENLDFDGGFINESAANHIGAIAMISHSGLRNYGIIINGQPTPGAGLNIILTGKYAEFTGYCVTCSSVHNADIYVLNSGLANGIVNNKDILVYDLNTTGTRCYGFITGGTTDETNINCAVTNMQGATNCRGFTNYQGTQRCYNCTVLNIGGTGIGFYRQVSAVWHNCYAGLTTTADFQGAATTSYCISEDGTASGIGSQTGRPPANQFVNAGAGTENIHLILGSNCINNGTTIPAVPDDIDGTARPVYGAYDVGADEFDGLVPIISGSETIDDNNENIMIEPVPRPTEGFLALDISAIIVNLDDFDFIISAWGPLGDRVIGHYNVTSDGVDITIAVNGAAGAVTQNRKIELDHISVFASEGIHIQRIRNSAIDRDIDMNYYFTTKQMVA